MAQVLSPVSLTEMVERVQRKCMEGIMRGDEIMKKLDQGKTKEA